MSTTSTLPFPAVDEKAEKQFVGPVTALSGGYTGPSLPHAPDSTERASYASRNLLRLTVPLILSAVSIVTAQLLLELHHPIAIVFALFTVPFAVYQLISLPVNFTGRSFDLRAHDRRVREWNPLAYPTVDVFLPVCGEPLDILRNTWEGVTDLWHAFPGQLRPWVLDDGHSDDTRELARDFGFGYIRRPVRRYKKSGNLRHAFALTSSPFIIIFDADFRPRADFLAETLPYMDDPATGIVQTPQFFRSVKGQTWVERAAGVTLEVFYRSVQQARDRFGSALCVGSNALYRRTALEPSGGCVAIPYAEDSHTGLDARRHGFALKYLPVPLAAGLCPSGIDAFMKQQYRWSNGATSLVWGGHMWRVPMPWTSRLPYIAGWLWNFTTALRTVMLPLIPVALLIVMPGEVRLRNSLLLVPALLTGAVLYPLWHRSRWTLGAWPLSIATGWAQVIALWDYCRGHVMTWTPTIGPSQAPLRFRRCVTWWNGTLAVAWLGLVTWRIVETGSPQFAVIAALGIVNALIVGRIVFPGRAR